MRHGATDTVWLKVLADAGFHITRSPGSFVSYDGRGGINMAPDDEMDDDDHIAQIVLHELCHHLVEGEDSRNHADWGLDNMDERHVPREHAALRVQAALADRVGLRDHFVATTDFRPYYEALGEDPLVGDDPAAAIAREALARFEGWYLRQDVLRSLENEARHVTRVRGDNESSKS